MKRIDWNEASRQGLVERINTEILHPLGLAMFRTAEDGVSPGLLIAEDGKWEYAPGTPGILPTVTAERDALQERLNVTDQKVDDLTTENAALCLSVKRSAMRIKELDLLFGRYLIGMRSAVIELDYGDGPEAAMRWIRNGLIGPGQLPPDDAFDAQAYFDREIVAIDAGMQEVLAFFDPKAAEVPL